jgi:NAD(P)H-hydrate epimerase
VITDRETGKLVNSGSIESMTYSGDDILGFLASKDAVLVGPGLRDDDDNYAAVRALVGAISLPLVLDASGLNAFAARAADVNPQRRPRVITPHPGEMARLLGRETKDVNASRIDTARETARLSNCVVVLKGHQTLIADPEGHVSVNPTGNPGMATGGMGDVLGGMIAAFLARGLDPFDAATTAVYLHGFAGDLLLEEHGDTGLAALDLAEKLPVAIRKLRAD